MRWTVQLLCLLGGCVAVAAQELPPIIRDVHYPDLNHDASQVAFSYHGDIWVAPVETGIARRLTIHEAYDSRPKFSPDGRSIAFMSNRYGNEDLFIVPATGGHIQRVTYHSAPDNLAGWSPDGKKLLFYGPRRDHQRYCPYEIEIETGYVRPLFRDVSNIVVAGYSPDGNYLCGVRRGVQWWRKGYRGSANSQVLVYDIGADTMAIVTDFAGPDRWPVFSADGSRLHFVSEREGRPNVFSMDLRTRETKALTHFDEDAVTWLSISGNRKWLVFEWNFDVHMLSVSGGEPRKLTLRARIASPKTFEKTETLTEGVEEMAVNRDGSLVAVRLRQDIFFVKPGSKNDAIRITDWPGKDFNLRWSPDGKQLAYVSGKNGTDDIWVADAQTYETRCLLQDDRFRLGIINYTRDGRSILFRHRSAGADGVFALEVETGQVTSFLPGPEIRDVRISPDGRWILAEMWRPGPACDLHVRPLEGGEWVNITKHLGDNWQAHWSPDGERIFFVSYRDGNGEVYSIALQRQPPGNADYQEQPERKAGQGEKHEGENAEARHEEKDAWQPKTIAPFEIDFQHIEQRAKRLTNTPETEGILMILPDGDAIVYQKGREIWVMDPDGKSQRRLVTGTSAAWFTRLQGDGKAIFFVDSGKLKKVSANGGAPVEIDWKAKIHWDERVVQKAAFRQAWDLLDEHFYDRGFRGVDWKAQYERYAPYCDGTLVKEDLHHLIQRMMGDLNASHLRIWGGGGGPSGPSTGCLGITADPEHRGPGVRVADVIPDGPADQPDSTIAVGEYIMAVEGQEAANNEDFHRRLNGQTGKRVKLSLNREAKLEGARETSIKPVSLDTVYNLRYGRWERKNREMVRELSDGQVYYAHMRTMLHDALERFKRELFGEAQRHEALLIDLRNRGGGGAYYELLELLTSKVHASHAERGEPLRPSPGTPFDGPKAVLIHQRSRCGSEIFVYGFRQEGLGKLIGMTTWGAVIDTYTVTLANGSQFRVPSRGFFTLEGVDMENLGVKPDVEVPYPYEACRDGRDPQIEAAVKVLLEELKTHPRAKPPEVDR